MSLVMLFQCLTINSVNDYDGEFPSIYEEIILYNMDIKYMKIYYESNIVIKMYIHISKHFQMES